MKCIKCGQEGKLIDNLCPRCLLETKDVLKIKLPQIIICPNCLKFKYRNKWVSEGVTIEEVIIAALRKNIKIKKLYDCEYDINCKLYSYNRGKVEIAIFFEGIKKLEYIDFKIIYELCNNCRLIKTKYKGSVLQVRNYKDINEFISFIENKHIALISEIKKKDSGFDIYFADTRTALAVALFMKRKYKWSIKRSAKQVGMEDGMTKYRSYICIRPPRRQ